MRIPSNLRKDDWLKYHGYQNTMEFDDHATMDDYRRLNDQWNLYSMRGGNYLGEEYANIEDEPDQQIEKLTEFLKSLKNNIKQTTKVVIVVPNSSAIWRYIFREKWYGWDPPVHCHLYNQKSLKIIMNKVGYKIEYISSLNKIDALAAALNHSGFKLNKLN